MVEIFANAKVLVWSKLAKQGHDVGRREIRSRRVAILPLLVTAYVCIVCIATSTYRSYSRYRNVNVKKAVVRGFINKQAQSTDLLVFSAIWGWPYHPHDNTFNQLNRPKSTP